LHRAGGRIITFWDDEYPANLKRIYDPPAFLFVKGTFREREEHAIAIVGTRNPTPYGNSIAEKFAAELSRSGLTIVSGLARGIDTVAHSAALRAGGRTLAIIGSGLDVIYPAENKQLAARIAEHGAIVTEHEMGAKPDAVNFPRRNRIISGIALGTLVAETGIEGGAMITAAIALDQNREVFAIPSGLSDRRVSGTNRLIKEGKALLTESVADILSELGPRLRNLPGQPGNQSSDPGENLSLFERRLYDAMDDQPLHIDQITARTSFPAGDALVHLLSLEFKGLVVQRAGKIFVKI
jgi:DNA processing protein